MIIDDALPVVSLGVVKADEVAMKLVGSSSERTSLVSAFVPVTMIFPSHLYAPAVVCAGVVISVVLASLKV